MTSWLQTDAILQSRPGGGGGGGGYTQKKVPKIPKIKRGVVYFTSKISCKQNKKMYRLPRFQQEDAVYKHCNCKADTTWKS